MPVRTKSKYTIDMLPANWREIMMTNADKGKSVSQTMLALGIKHFNTLAGYKRDIPDFDDAWSEYQVRTNAYYENLAQNYALGDEHLGKFGSFNALKFNMVNRGINWSDKVEMESSVKVSSDASAVDLFHAVLEASQPKKDE